MDKNQAVDFIIRQYTLGYPQEEIVQQLSQQMGAPADLVGKFVKKTVDEAFPEVPAPTPPAPTAAAQPYNQDFYSTPEPGGAFEEAGDGFVDLDADETGFGLPAADYRDGTADGYGYEAQDAGASDFYTQAEASPEYSQSGNGNDNLYSLGYENPAGESDPSPDDLPQPAMNYLGTESRGPAPAVSASEETLRALETNSELVALVLNALGKNTKQSDVVMEVCEREGLDWKDAQRLVARIQSRNRKKLASKQNMLVIPLCILAIVGGGALVLAGIIEFLRLREIYNASQGAADYMVVNSSYNYLRGVLPWLITGIILAVGGVIGLVKAIQNQTD